MQSVHPGTSHRHPDSPPWGGKILKGVVKFEDGQDDLKGGEKLFADPLVLKGDGVWRSEQVIALLVELKFNEGIIPVLSDCDVSEVIDGAIDLIEEEDVFIEGPDDGKLPGAIGTTRWGKNKFVGKNGGVAVVAVNGMFGLLIFSSDKPKIKNFAYLLIYILIK